MRFAILFAPLILGGCASLGGNAYYQYEMTKADGSVCKVRIDSGRSITGPAFCKFDENCNAECGVQAAEQGRAVSDEVLLRAIDKIPGVPNG